MCKLRIGSLAISGSELIMSQMKFVFSKEEFVFEQTDSLKKVVGHTVYDHTIVVECMK